MTQATSSPYPTYPPGWYDDGVTAGVVRWFDGSAWTEHVRPTMPPASAGTPVHPATPAQGWGGAPAPAAASDFGPSNAMHWMVPVGRSWQSVVAGYLGIFALFIPPVAFASIPLGIVALRQARVGGHGRGRAWFAIVAGVVGLLWGAAALLS